MRILMWPLLATALASPGVAQPGPVAATNPERESAYRDLADCRAQLERTRRSRAAHSGAAVSVGSWFNVVRGNVSRCEIVEGEPVIVVYPRGSAPNE